MVSTQPLAMASDAALRSADNGELRRGWPIIATGLTGMAVQASGYLSLGTMMTPLIAEFGWSRTEIVAVAAFSAVLSVVMAPLVGVMLNRHGPRRVALAGFAVYPFALAAAALAGPDIWSWWAIWLVITTVNFFIGPLVWTYAVTNRFVRRRGIAIGIVLSGMGVANAIIPLFLVGAIELVGWRGAYVALAALVGIVGGGVTWKLFREPEPVAPRADDVPLPPALGMTARQAMGTLRYWQLCLVIFLVSAAIGTLNIHLQPILIDAGATMVGAAALTAVFGPAQIVGRLLGGWLLDRISGPLLGFVMFLLPVASCAVMLTGNAMGAAAFVVPICVGVAAGVELDLATYLASRYFGPRHFGSVFSGIFCFFTIGYTVAPLAAAHVRDTAGSYEWVLIAIALSLPVAAVGVGLLGRYPDSGKFQ
jgi:MFS family permease